MRKFKVCDLQFDALISDDRPVFTPVKLKGFTRGKGERDESTTTDGTCKLLLL